MLFKSDLLNYDKLINDCTLIYKRMILYYISYATTLCYMFVYRQLHFPKNRERITFDRGL